ncbi:archaea-specific SMC-related protein [Salinigranum marinum]|uniref:archaea-specific SMC-related protein n=1 Tax=Salinigranum marinum TaxID=1515595 RepID=UPI002989DB7E|nr:archaea-specific SMC-related protein [Salinigranum marinum]
MTWTLSLENIAGIRRAEAVIEPGVNAVRASNWQGKSSFLAGIETVFGTETSLTEGQDTGRVALRTEDDEFVVELARRSGSVSRTGTPYLSDDYDLICAELFAFLGDDNAIRRAVRDGENLEELLTRPLDFENIDERIADIRVERDQVETERQRAADAASRLPQLQQRVTKLEATLEELRVDRSELEDETADTDDARREELSSLRAERERVETRIQRLETTVERVRERLTETEAELDALTVPSTEEFEEELETTHEKLRDVERKRELLQSVFEANKRVLDEGEIALLTEVSHEVLSDRAACWLCGQATTRDEMETQLDALDARISELRADASASRERVEELETKRDEARTAARRERDLEDRLTDLRSQRAEDEETLENARQRRDELVSRIESFTTEIETTDDRVTDLESEIKYTEAELADAREELETAETRAAQREVLAEEYDELTQEIRDLRTRKETVKRRTREAFSSSLAEVLERFETGFETARLTSTFDLVVARDGREARLDALSEGERELLGIVAALAGHEAFEVAERVPVLLLDGLGGLAGDNLDLLVEYLTDRAEYLVLTAYPEHGDFDGHELSPSDWDVVSHRADAEAAS